MADNPTEAMLPVTQEDREAAAQFVALLPYEEHPMAVAFARHRLAAQPEREAALPPFAEAWAMPDDVKAVIEKLRVGVVVVGSEPGGAQPIYDIVTANQAMRKAATMLETFCAEIGRAVAVEREECARVADKWAEQDVEPAAQRMAEDIAISIRARATLAGELTEPSNSSA